jgi:hypothetical protein
LLPLVNFNVSVSLQDLVGTLLCHIACGITFWEKLNRVVDIILASGDSISIRLHHLKYAIRVFWCGFYSFFQSMATVQSRSLVTAN